MIYPKLMETLKHILWFQFLYQVLNVKQHTGDYYRPKNFQDLPSEYKDTGNLWNKGLESHSTFTSHLMLFSAHFESLSFFFYFIYS